MLPPSVTDLAETQHGLITRPQLRALGLGSDQVRSIVTSRQWQAVTPTVMRRVGSPRTAAQEVLSAVLDAGPGAVLSHLPAARWWGQRGCALRPVHVTRAAPTRRRCELAVVHRVRRLPPTWLTQLDGVPIVRPELLALQLFAVCSAGRAERLTDRLWSDRLLSGPSVARFLAAMGERGRNGTAGLRRYLERRGDDYVPPASGLESRAMELFREAGVPMRRQVDTGDDITWTGRVDFRHEWLPLIAEIQSERHHTALCDREADANRLATLRRAGYTVVELTDTMVWSQPAEVVERLTTAATSLL